MTANIPYSYDEVPYHSFPFADSHPDRLPTAELYPQGRFIGIDLSERQIAAGQQAVTAVGLTNLELRQASILDVDASWGQFDYVIAHGVFSWVPEPVQDKILSICHTNLQPNGIAYISYNTLPGWHMRGMIRDMMRYH